MIATIDPKSLTVLVTGATAGIGEATCRRFVESGAKVIATGRRADRLDALRGALGDFCHTVTLDIRERDAVERAFSHLPEAFAVPNVIVANAGLALGLESAQEANVDDWDDMIATNINGLLYTVRALLPGLVARGEGHVVLLGSVAGDYPYPGGNVYGATKSFVKQFALNLRADLHGKNVRVTNIEPGMTETEFSLVRFKGDAKRSQVPYTGTQPMSAADIAETIFFAATLPRHVNINRLQVMPVAQSFAPFQVARE